MVGQNLVRDGVQPGERAIDWHLLKPAPSNEEGLGDDVVRDTWVDTAARIGEEGLKALLEDLAKAFSAFTRSHVSHLRPPATTALVTVATRRWLARIFGPVGRRATKRHSVTLAWASNLRPSPHGAHPRRTSPHPATQRGPSLSSDRIRSPGTWIGSAALPMGSLVGRDER